MARWAERDEYQRGTLVGGLPTCTFRPKMYHRIISNIVVGNSATGGVFCYRGQLGSTPVAQNLLGANNTLKGDLEIPAGQTFFVQWAVAGAAASDAFARVSWERDDNPLEAGPARGDEWASNAITSLLLPNGALPNDPAIVIGEDLPACMQADYASAIFMRPPGSLVPDSAPIWFLAQALVPAGGNIWQTVDEGYLVNDGVDCGFMVYRRRRGRNIGGDVQSFEFYGSIATSGDVTSSNGPFIEFVADTSFTVDTTSDIFLNVTGGARFVSNGRHLSNGDLVSFRQANKNTFANASDTASSSGVYRDYPGAVIVLQKLYNETELLIRWAPTYFTDSLSAGAEFAVRIGSTDHRTHRLDPAVSVQRRQSTFGERTISGVNAGSVTITGRWSMVGSGNNFVTQDDDYYSLTAQEVAVEI